MEVNNKTDQSQGEVITSPTGSSSRARARDAGEHRKINKRTEENKLRGEDAGKDEKK